MAYFKKVVILDTVYFLGGKTLDNRIYGQSLIKSKSTQIYGHTQSPSTNIMSTNILVIFLCCLLLDIAQEI